MRRPASILLLEASLVIEWVFLTPVLAFSPIALVAGFASGGRAPILFSLELFLAVFALAALNVACWRQRPWALWIRAGFCFLTATGLASLVPAYPAVAIFVAERMGQTGLAVWLAARS